MMFCTFLLLRFFAVVFLTHRAESPATLQRASQRFSSHHHHYRIRIIRNPDDDDGKHKKKSSSKEWETFFFFVCNLLHFSRTRHDYFVEHGNDLGRDDGSLGDEGAPHLCDASREILRNNYFRTARRLYDDDE